MVSFSIGLDSSKPSHEKSLSKPTVGSQKPALGFDSDSEEEGPASKASTHNESQRNRAAKEKAFKRSNTDKHMKKPSPKNDTRPSLSSLRDHITVAGEAQSVDESIYDYDAYHATSSSAIAASKRAAAKADAASRVPKYITGMQAAAETRKRDQLRAQDKLLQREREEEGDQFEDKEKFVTGAYKQQQEEVRKAEEVERLNEEEEMKSRKGKGMGGFYKKVIEDEEQRYKEKIEAAEKVKTGAFNGLEVQEDEQERDPSELARKLNSEGAKVLVNDEGEVTDKRQLLVAGLNVAPKRDPPTNPSARQPQESFYRPDPNSFKPGGSDVKRAMRERQTRMVEAQLEAQAKRQAEEEAEELQKQHQAAKSTKTEGDISSAKERYLQRKREAAAAKASGLD